jgi:hypothetical protein
MNIIELAISKDGGRNFGPWKQRSMGATGRFIQRLEWLQLGRASLWVIRVRVSAPVKRDLIDAAWLPEATNR